MPPQSQRILARVSSAECAASLAHVLLSAFVFPRVSLTACAGVAVSVAVASAFAMSHALIRSSASASSSSSLASSSSTTLSPAAPRLSNALSVPSNLFLSLFIATVRAVSMSADWLPFSARFIVQSEGKYGPRHLNDEFVYFFGAIAVVSVVYSSVLQFTPIAAPPKVTFASLHKKWTPMMLSLTHPIIANTVAISTSFCVCFHVVYTLFAQSSIYSLTNAIVSAFTSVSSSDIPWTYRVSFWDLSAVLENFFLVSFVVMFWQIYAVSHVCTDSLPQIETRVQNLLPVLTIVAYIHPMPYSSTLALQSLRTLSDLSPRARDPLFNASPKARIDSSDSADSATASPWITSAGACLRIVEGFKDELDRLHAQRVEVLGDRGGKKKPVRASAPATNGDMTSRGRVGNGEPDGLAYPKVEKSSVSVAMRAVQAAGMGAMNTPKYRVSPVKKMRLLTGAVKPSPGKMSFLDALQDAQMQDEAGAKDSVNAGSQAVRNVKDRVNLSSADDAKVFGAGAGGLYKRRNGASDEAAAISNAKPAKDSASSSKNAVGIFDFMYSLIVSLVDESKKGRGKQLKLEGITKVTKRTFAEYETLSIAVEAVSKLLIAATKEDQYGIIHRDIPDVLGSLLSCLIAVETFMAQPPGVADFSEKQSCMLLEGFPGGQIVLKDAYAVVVLLQTNIYYNTTHLGDHLARYKFYPAVADKLKRFIEFLE
ncbi:hypothetical protein HDU81_006742 [Chytriomyces hyalinus]|nr:hypothetical protein HDU81_006742 [Chytriomyces hyalinus]